MTLEQTKPTVQQDKTHPLYRSEKKLRREVEDMLRDIAFVLHCTRRVKEQILVSRSL